MSLSHLLTQEFSNASRARGDRYYKDGNVTIVEGTSSLVNATATGTDEYRVRIVRHDAAGKVPQIDASCECPYFRDVFEPCKHIWATLRLADERGYLTGQPGTATHAADLELVAPTDDADEDLNPFTGDEGEFILSPTPQPAAASTGAKRQGWDQSRTFLAYLRQHRAAPAPAPPVFRYANGELLYVFNVPATLAGRGLTLDVMWRQRKKSGDWGKPKPAGIVADDVHLAPEADRDVLARLLGATPFNQYGYGYGTSPYGVPFGTAAFTVPAALMSTLVPLIAGTGRAWVRLTADPSMPLAPVGWDDGPPWQFRVDVSATPQGFLVGGFFERPGVRLPIGDPVLVLGHGLLFTPGIVARLEVPEDFAFIAALRASGPVEIAQQDAPLLAEALARFGLNPVDVPDDLRVEQVRVTPRPHLHIARSPGWNADNRLRAAMAFEYDGAVLATGGPAVAYDAARRRMVHRSPESERAALDRLQTAGFKPRYDYASRASALEINARHLPTVVRSLLAEGWRVEAEGRLFRSPGAVRMSVTSGVDWFDLNATVEFGDTAVALADVLAALKRRDGSVRLDDGTFGLLPEEWLRRYAPLAATGEVTETGLRFKPSQAALLDVLLSAEEPQTTVAVDETFARVRRELAAFDQIQAIDPPASFTGTLRGYQREGLGWLRFLRQFGFGGCLADDMGLGKTVMVLALLAWWREHRPSTGDPHRPSLIVVPRSLVHNWIAEAARFTPDLRVLDFSHSARGTGSAFDDHDIVLATYGTLREDAARLKDVLFEYVILDEAQAIKNATTVSAKAARLLRGRHRLALSGTPIENHLGELWSLFEFLNPGLLGASRAFEGATSAQRPDADTLQLVARGIRPFILRRTKEQVASDLPARSEQTIVCELEGKQRALYDSLRQHYRQSLLKRVDQVGLAKSKMHILEALLRLRQAACHAGLVDETRRGDSSAKFDVLLPRLTEVIAEGHKALVFSQFTSLLALLRARLDKEGVVYEYLDGQTRDRETRVDRFQSDAACPLFLISLKAGGLGLNLTAADYVFLLDPWWNPAAEAQAIDRAHRIGQKRDVFACRLIAKDTVEEKVVELQQSKRDLADAILRADAGGVRHISRDDLELLLS